MQSTKAAAILLLAFFVVPLAGAFAPRLSPGGVPIVGGGAFGATFPSAVQSNITPTGDSTITSAYPSRNFGVEGSFLVGSDPSLGTVSRALLRFDLDSVPATAQVLDATLGVYVQEAAGGSGVDVHRMLAPWVEGTGGAYAFERTVLVSETAGVARAREPVEARILLGTPMALDPQSDFRIFDAAGNEVPSQVIRVAYAGPDVREATVVFESSNGAGETRTYVVRYGYAFGSPPAYRLRPPWVSLWNFTAGTTYASLAVADLDGDTLLETILGSSDGNVYAIRADGSQLWATNLGAPIAWPVAVADVNNDSSLEVLAMTAGASNHRVYVLRSDGSSLWDSGADPGKETQGPMIVEDTTGDGIAEIFVAANDRQVYAFNITQTAPLWIYGLGPGETAFGGALANFTGGPAPELLFGTSQGVLHAITTSGSMIWTAQPGSNSMLQTPGVGDLDGDGLPELIAGDRAVNGNQFAVWGENGTRKWIRPTGSDQSGGNLLVDWGDDGRLEIVFAKSLTGQIGAMTSDGTWLWNFTTGAEVYSTPTAADVDGDGEEDIVFGSFDSTLYVVASDGTPVWSLPVDTPVRGTPVIADIDGDGYLDIVFATETRTSAVRSAGLGHDARIGGYNVRNTGRYLDGNSPDGASLLTTSIGSELSVSGTGVTWLTRDGTAAWTVSGGEYDVTAEGSATATAGSWATWNLTRLVTNWTRNLLPNVGIMLRPASEATQSRLVIASREAVGTAPFLSILYTTDLGPRIATRVPDQSAPEDSPPWTLNLVGFAYDPDTPLANLSWDLAGTDSTLYEYTGGNVTGNHLITFRPKPDRSGTDQVDLLLFDEMGRYAWQSLWVNLTPVNDPPSFSPAPPTTFYVHFDSPYTFDFAPYLKDPDHTLQQLFLTSSDAAHTSVAAHRVTFVYPQSFVGDWQFVTITVSDGLDSASRTVAVLVTSDYPPEQRNDLPDVTMLEGETRRDVFGNPLGYYFFDPDNDTLFYTFGFTHLNITINADNTVDIEALADFWGTESVTFRATDPTGALLEDSILVFVTPVNDPPRIAGVPALTVHWDYPYEFDLAPYITDTDTPIDQISVSTSNPVSVAVSGRILTLLYPDLGTGQYTVPLVINVTDGVDWTYAPITVTVTDDYPPTLQRTLPDVTFLEDTFRRNEFDLDDYFYDNDSATVFYTSGQVRVVVTINVDHSVDFAADANWSGVETVRFRATDDRGALAEDTIKVIVQSVDDAPRILPIEDQIKDRHSWFLDLTGYLEDVDTDVSLLTVEARSAVDDRFVRAAGQNLLFEYPSDVNEDTVTILVSDGAWTTTATIRVQIRGPDLLSIFLPWFVAAGVAAASVVVWNRLRPSVEEVFLIHANGLPIAHLSRTLKAEEDTDVVTSMFTGVQNLMNDIFRARGAGDLNALQLGEFRVSLARGTSAFLVVLYEGRRSRAIERKARKVIEEVESRFGPVLANWSGAVDQLVDVKEFMEQFFKAKASAVLERQPRRRLGGVGGLGAEETKGIGESSDLPPPPPPDTDEAPLPPPTR